MTIQVQPGVTCTTDQLVQLASNALDLGLENPLDPQLVARLHPLPATFHVLILRSVLERVGGREVEAFARCYLLARVKDSDEGVPQDYFDVRLRDYLPLPEVRTPGLSTHSFQRTLNVDDVAPDDRTPT